MKHLLAINDINPTADWGGICENPKSLLKFVSESLFVEGEEVAPNYIKQEKVPTGIDRRIVWVKTSSPEGIGFLVDGRYKIIYFDYPVNIPFLHAPISILVDGLRELTTDEKTSYGITGGSSTMKWYMFSPDDITT